MPRDPWALTGRLGKKDGLIPLCCALLILVPSWIARRMGLDPGLASRLIAIGPAALLCYGSVRRPLSFATGLLVLYFA